MAIGGGWLRIRRPQVRVLPSAQQETAGLQQKRTPAKLFVRYFTCSMPQLVPQLATEATL
jgi:hypothetical protein